MAVHDGRQCRAAMQFREQFGMAGRQHDIVVMVGHSLLWGGKSRIGVAGRGIRSVKCPAITVSIQQPRARQDERSRAPSGSRLRGQTACRRNQGIAGGVQRQADIDQVHGALHAQRTRRVA